MPFVGGGLVGAERKTGLNTIARSSSTRSFELLGLNEPYERKREKP